MKSRLGHETPTIIELNHIFYLTFRSYQKSIIKISVEGSEERQRNFTKIKPDCKIPVVNFPGLESKSKEEYEAIRAHPNQFILRFET